MNHQNTFNIICSFLIPLELTKIRYLDSVRKKWIDHYLSLINIKSLQEKACPKCARWIDISDISNYTGFFDSFYDDEIRIQLIKNFFRYYSVNRTSLLCDICEYEEDYNDYNEYQMNNMPFLYKGDRRYMITIMHDTPLNWVIIHRFNKSNDTIEWNQYQKVVETDYHTDSEYETDMDEYEDF